jgi:FkbM family methyltransferase
VQLKLATLTALERAAAVARRLRLGFLVDALAPHVARPFERFAIDVDGVQLHGTDLAQLHYVRELAELGRERTFVALLAEAVPAGGVVLEGGAHLGYVTIHAARAAGSTGRVISFEPNLSIHGLLQQNLTANGVADRVTVRPLALSDRNGRASFHVSGDTSSLVDPGGIATAVEIDVVRADDAVSEPVDVVKLDVEGSEVAALRGMQRLLEGERAPQTLFVECHPELLERAGSSKDELLAVLAAAGYSVEWIDEANHRTAPLSEPWTDDYVNLRCIRA